MENTSGQGSAATVPAEIDRWNWGAFLLGWIWGIGNNTFIALLMFVPFVNFVMWFILGVKGSAWAWRNKRWDSVEHFKAVQRKWAKWGVIVVVIALAGAVALVFAVFASIKGSEAFQLAVAKLNASPQIAESIGVPVTTGLPTGSIQVSGPKGTASLSFGVSGSKGEGTAYVEATRDMGQWKIDRLAVEQQGKRIEVGE